MAWPAICNSTLFMGHISFAPPKAQPKVWVDTSVVGHAEALCEKDATGRTLL